MNINMIKQQIANKIGKKVKIIVYGMRNKTDYYEGTIYKIYPNIFTIMYQNEEKSFAYREVITGDIKMKFYDN